MSSNDRTVMKAVVGALIGLMLGGTELALAADLCVGPVARKAGDRGTIMPPGGRPPDGVLYFRIDDAPKIRPDAVRHTPVIVPDSPGKHVFRVYEDDAPLSAFKFSVEPGRVSCVRFDPFYETWRLTTGKTLAACGCKTDSSMKPIRISARR